MINNEPDIKEKGSVSAIILFAITAAVTALLSTVNQFTAPVIAQHDAEIAEISHKQVFKAAYSFSDRSDEFIGIEDKQIVTVFVALDEAGDPVGIVLETLSKGYGGDVKVMTAVSPDLEVVGLVVLSNNETPGLGTKITAQWFEDQFISNVSGVRFTLKQGESDKTMIDGLTGATLSSRAVVNAVNMALDFAEEIMGDIIAEGGTKGGTNG